MRIQTHFSAESTPGKVVAQFIDDVETMSDGRLKIQIHWSSEVVGQTETFGAAQQGILDCDMSGPSSNVGKDAGFRFVGDIMGGYDTPQPGIAGTKCRLVKHSSSFCRRLHG